MILFFLFFQVAQHEREKHVFIQKSAFPQRNPHSLCARNRSFPNFLQCYWLGLFPPGSTMGEKVSVPSQGQALRDCHEKDMEERKASCILKDAFFLSASPAAPFLMALGMPSSEMAEVSPSLCCEALAVPKGWVFLFPWVFKTEWRERAKFSSESQNGLGWKGP